MVLLYKCHWTLIENSRQLSVLILNQKSQRILCSIVCFDDAGYLQQMLPEIVCFDLHDLLNVLLSYFINFYRQS